MLGGVKEQTVGVYAQRLAEAGFVTLAYDSSYQGASGGTPHFFDEPMNRAHREVSRMKTHRQPRYPRAAICAAVFAWMFLLSAHRPIEATTIFTTTLTGGQETPPNASPATGSGTFILNDPMTALEFHIVFANLTSGIIAAHFHDAPPGIAGPVVRGMTFADGFVSGVMSGLFDGFWKDTDAQALTPPLVTELLAGNIYFNIHSTTFPGGEIRGQLNQVHVPEPASLLLLGSGLAGLGGIAWRRHRRK